MSLIIRFNELKSQSIHNRKFNFVNGCFDIIHMGHINLFNRIRNHNNNEIIIAINSDESVSRLKPGRPINVFYDRASIIAELVKPYLVIEFNTEEELETIIEEIRPIYMYKSEEYPLNKITGLKALRNNGGDLVLVERTDYSTTDIIKRCKAL